MERNSAKKWSFTELVQTLWWLWQPLHSTLSSFSSAEWFGTEFWEFASIFVPRNGILSCFLFRWRVQKGILIVCFHFGSTERNSELLALPLKDLEENSETLLLFLFNGTDSELFSLPRKGSDEIAICSVYFVFRGIIFFFGYSQPYALFLKHLLLRILEIT